MVRAGVSRIVPTGPSSVSRAPTWESVADDELVERAKGGDRWAAEALFRKHVESVMGLALRLLRHREEAEDVVQDAFVDALAGLGALGDGASWRSWLSGIVVHKAHRRFRRRKLLSLLGLYPSSHEALLTARARPGSSPELQAELGSLDAALAKVADFERSAWLLRYVEGYRLEEVARLSGCSLSTVKRRIASAQVAVKAHVAEEVNDG